MDRRRKREGGILRGWKDEEGRKGRGEKRPQSRKRSHGNAKCRDVAEANTGAARTGLKRGEHDKLPSLMPISAILPYEQVRGDLKRLPRTFFSLFPPPEVYKAVRRIYRAYIHSQRVHRGEEARVYVYTTPFYVCVLYATVSTAPCQVPARIIRGERARNTRVLAHSARETADRIRMRPSRRCIHA